jgi:hypothetical protein
MAQEEGISFEKIAQQWQDTMIDSWGKMAKQTVASDAFGAASSAYLDWTLNCQKQIRGNSAQFLDALEFPKRSDLARISKQISSAESRIGDCEDTLDSILSTLRRLEKKIEQLQAE